jgi:AraC-like DNA-binding protein
VRYLTIPPPPSLVEYVRFFWILESDQPYEHRSVADGGAEMIFHYQGAFDEINPGGNSPSALSSIRGTTSGYQIFRCTSAFGMIGIYFYPYAIPELFHIPANELSNEMPDLHTIFKREGTELEEQVMTCRTNTGRIDLIICFLLKRLKQAENRNAVMHSFLRTLIHNGGKTDVEALAGQFSLSRRQFERKFKALSGFSPKMYERIIRFQRAADEYDRQYKPLTQIALEYGYYDQSHFTNEFRKFSGYSPKDYFSGKETGYEWRDAHNEMSQSSKI